LQNYAFNSTETGGAFKQMPRNSGAGFLRGWGGTKRLTEEQYEYDLFNEMLCRLETQNVLLLFAAWDKCIENEKKLTGKEPDDFSLHIYKVGYTYKLCYLPKRK
jgi:hypothetical protein